MINNIHKAVLFSVMVDETSDVSNEEQPIIIIDYVCESADDKSVLIGEFLMFFSPKV